MSPIIEFSIMCEDEILYNVILSQEGAVVERVTERKVYQQFASNSSTRDEVYDWLEGRCFPYYRDNREQLLSCLALPDYNPIEILRVTHGLLWDDSYWVKFKYETYMYDDIRLR